MELSFTVAATICGELDTKEGLSMYLQCCVYVHAYTPPQHGGMWYRVARKTRRTSAATQEKPWDC